MPNQTHKKLFIAAIATIACAFSTHAFSKDRAKIQGSISIQGKTKKDYPGLAKISLQEAAALAAKAVPGKVVEIALDDEDGFLVYEIEVMGADHQKKELLLDAGNGKTLLVKQDKEEEDDDEDND